ncbi:NAD(P)-dependent oxidoreductase [Pleomorphochaeta sp. DL1XJH-081]|uniref:NAD(P)-dependent oxidoreductase n=1 Tax=Pleomorphochaeta sp. DL1XJH-081 TaxID=3409690 RepID=UPI003BB5E526
MENNTATLGAVGWIGTGVMGRWMAHHIVPLASPLYVYNRTKSKTAPLVSEGATAVDLPKEIAEKCRIIFTIVGHPSDVEAVYFGENGLLQHAQEGTIFIDMTTTKPSLAIEINKAAKKIGCDSIDAPVSGGDVGARNGQLSIMAGGTKESFEKILPFFQEMGKSAVLQGPAGSGQHTKMCNQIVIAGTMIGVSESLLYARKAGLDGETLVQTIGKGAAGCWTLDNLAPRVLKDDFKPGFMIDHFIKDMGIALEESKNMGLALPGLALVQQLYIALQGAGEGSNGTQALVKALDRLNSTHLWN